MFYSFKLTILVSYPAVYDTATRQKLFDNFLLGYKYYCIKKNITVEGTHSAVYHFFKGELPNNPPLLYMLNIPDHRSRLHTLVTYTLHHKNVEQHMIREVSEYAVLCFKNIAMIYGGVLVDPDDTTGDKGSAELS